MLILKFIRQILRQLLLTQISYVSHTTRTTHMRHITFITHTAYVTQILPVFSPDTMFLFCGRKASKIKGLVWEGDGFLLFTKRVEEGRFSCRIMIYIFPKSGLLYSLCITYQDPLRREAQICCPCSRFARI